MHVRSPAPRRSLRTRALSIAIASALGLACEAMGPPPDRNPTQAWSQDTVTGLAGQLATSVSALYETAYKDPNAQAPNVTGEGIPYAGAIDSLRVLGEEARELHSQLDAGKGRDETLGTYKAIKEHYRDAKESAAATFVPSDLGSAGGQAANLLTQLDGYYGNW